jgi:hypothetical protein
MRIRALSILLLTVLLTPGALSAPQGAAAQVTFSAPTPGALLNGGDPLAASVSGGDIGSVEVRCDIASVECTMGASVSLGADATAPATRTPPPQPSPPPPASPRAQTSPPPAPTASSDDDAPPAVTANTADTADQATPSPARTERPAKHAAKEEKPASARAWSALDPVGRLATRLLASPDVGSADETPYRLPSPRELFALAALTMLIFVFLARTLRN